MTLIGHNNDTSVPAPVIRNLSGHIHFPRVNQGQSERSPPSTVLLRLYVTIPSTFGNKFDLTERIAQKKVDRTLNIESEKEEPDVD